MRRQTYLALFGASLFGCFTQIPDKPDCGDGEVQITEECDDQNDTNDDGCDNNCTFAACGNNILNEDEACDDNNTVDGDGCAADCSRLESCGNGAVDALEACDDGNEVSGDGCRGDCLKEEVCGDNVLDANEICDDGNTANGDGCAGDCSFVEGCGDGVVQPPEVCDDGNIASGDGCNAACSNAEICGDGDATDPGEECDDGNLFPADGCDPNCLLEPTDFTEVEDNDAIAEANGIFTGDITISADVTHDSGNGRDLEFFQLELFFLSDLKLSIAPINPASCSGRIRMALLRFDGSVVNEVANNGSGQCPLLDTTIDRQPAGTYFVRVTEDNGGNQAANLQYSITFNVQSLCGDILVESTEACDDGNFDSGDGCRGDCRGVEECGDGLIDDINGEVCDDDDTTNGDGCSSACAVESGFVCNGEPSNCNTVCGDSIPAGAEQCDDGNATNTDSCVNCLNARCGDGFTRTGTEQCDDGNAINTDGCKNNCQLPVCGDTVVSTGEQCDDGNAINTDACKNNCQLPVCGDAVVSAGEQCDNGGNNSNTVPNACRTNCTNPICGDGVVDSGESCDTNNLAGESCSTLSGGALPNGNLSCDGGCNFDGSGCF